MPPRHYLITGAGRGIGRGLSRLLLQKGHRVVLVDNDVAELQNTAALLQTRGHISGKDFQTVECNLRKPSDIASAATEAGELFRGRVDCLINNAAYTGGAGGSPLGELSLDDWNQSIETNLTAPMLMTQACLPLLRRTPSRAQGGSVIFISSTRAFMSEANNEAYSATKAGLLGLSQSMAVSLASEGIRSNAILPGWINVMDESKAADESGQTWEDGLTKDDHAWHLNGRVGKVEDVLRAVEYLVEADFASGTEVVVDGGVTRKMVYPEE